MQQKLMLVSLHHSQLRYRLHGCNCACPIANHCDCCVDIAQHAFLPRPKRVQVMNFGGGYQTDAITDKTNHQKYKEVIRKDGPSKPESCTELSSKLSPGSNWWNFAKMICLRAKLDS